MGFPSIRGKDARGREPGSEHRGIDEDQAARSDAEDSLERSV
jgi:hypothetical protein